MRAAPKSPTDLNAIKKKRRCIARLGSGKICGRVFVSQHYGNWICCDCNYWIERGRNGSRVDGVYVCVFD